MKRVLIISYYWPPNGGAGVYRWLKFSKYLPQYGWKPVIYTPADPDIVAYDPGLLSDVHNDAEVIKRPIREPFTLYKRFTGRPLDQGVQAGFLNEEGRVGWKEDLALWVRSNLFVPDARIWWVSPSIRYLKAYLRRSPVAAVITTGPPHSMHLIGRALKRSMGVRWLADLRDPWTDIDFYAQLKLTRRADALHRRLERSVLTEADRVVTVSWSWARDLEALGDRPVEVITNGYDPDDLPIPPEPLDQRWSLVHVGSMTSTRNLPGLWGALSGLCRSEPGFADRFVLRFVGPVDHEVLRSIAAAGLEDKVERIGRVDHAGAMRYMQAARVLLLPINDTPNSKGILPGKLFEYLSTARPILAIGPADGDIARVLGDEHLRMDREPPGLDSARLLDLFRTGGRTVKRGFSEYARPVLAGQVASLLTNICEGPG